MSASEGLAGITQGTTGARMGIDGADWRAALKTYAVFFTLLAVIDSANVFAEVREHATSGHPILIVEPIIWETSRGGWASSCCTRPARLCSRPCISWP